MLEPISLQHIGNRVEFQLMRKLQRRVAAQLGRRSFNFPGAQPITLQRKHLSVFESNEYLIYEKSDGIRCLLYLTKEWNAAGQLVQAQYLIDRKNDYYLLGGSNDLGFPGHSDIEVDAARLHAGTLIDGELVLQRQGKTDEMKWVFVMFDCLLINGQRATQDPFSSRRQKLNTLIWKPWAQFLSPSLAAAGESPTLAVELKQAFPMQQLEQMFTDVIPNLNHDNDGIIFAPKSARYTFGTDRLTFKWKPAEENTVDFRFNARRLAHPAGGFECQLQAHIGDGHHVSFAAFAADVDQSTLITMALEPTSNVIVECSVDATGLWRPKTDRQGRPKVRHDKVRGNYISVVEEILESIREAIVPQDLIKAATRIL